MKEVFRRPIYLLKKFRIIYLLCLLLEKLIKRNVYCLLVNHTRFKRNKKVNLENANKEIYIDLCDKGISRTLYTEETHEPISSHIFCNEIQNICSKDKITVFVDVGANLGYYTCLFDEYSFNSEINCFEPNPKIRNLLKENVDMNCIEADISPKAIWTESKYQNFRISDHSNWSSLVKKPTGENVIQVESTTLNDIYNNDGMQEKNFVLRMDLEGHEIDIIKNADFILNNCSNQLIFIEIHPVQYGEKEKKFASSLIEEYDVVSAARMRERLNITEPEHIDWSDDSVELILRSN